MRDKYVQGNVAEVDALIERARERLAQYENHLAKNPHAEGAHEVADRLRKDLAILRVYRSFIEKMMTAGLRPASRGDNSDPHPIHV
jgi:hypothetical protein